MRTLMLDVDGVLVTGRPRDGAHLFTDLERDLGLPLPLLQREFFAPRWADIVTGRKPLEPELADVLARIAPDVSVARLIDYWFENDSRLDAAVLSAVSELRRGGCTVFLATNQEHRRARYLMTDLGLERHVDGMIYSAAVGHRKPAPEFYAAATATAGHPPTDIALVDDTLENVTAARAFGWRAVHWTPSMDLAAALAAAV